MSTSRNEILFCFRYDTARWLQSQKRFTTYIQLYILSQNLYGYFPGGNLENAVSQTGKSTSVILKQTCCLTLAVRMSKSVSITSDWRAPIKIFKAFFTSAQSNQMNKIEPQMFHNKIKLSNPVTVLIWITALIWVLFQRDLELLQQMHIPGTFTVLVASKCTIWTNTCFFAQTLKYSFTNQAKITIMSKY